MGLFDSTTSTKPNMPGYVKDLQKDIFKDASKLYKSDYSASYTKPSFAGFSDPTKMAFDGLTTLAGNNSGNNGMAPHLQSIMSNGGFTPGQTEAVGGMKDLASSPFLDRMISGTGLTNDQESVASKYRTDMSDPFDITKNPAYMSVRQQALDTQSDALAGRAAAAGRYGGGMDQAILAREQGNLANRMDDAEYRNWQTRGDAAAGNLAGLSQTGVGNTTNAIGQKSDLLGQVFNAENAGLDRMRQAYDTAQQPYMTQRAVGQEYENEQQKIINDEMRMQQEQDPFARLQQYLALANGTPTGTTSTSSPSWAQILAGGGLGVLGLGSMLGGFGAQPSAASAGAVA